MLASLFDFNIFTEFDLTSGTEHLLNLFIDTLSSSTSYRAFIVGWIIC